jgi:hypothetical protein
MRRWPAPIDHCYILCDPVREPDRANYLTSWLQSNNVDPSCVTMCLDTYGTDPLFQSSAIWSLYDPWSTAYGRRVANGTSRSMKPSELSLVLNFMGAAKRAIDAGHEVVMILESDVLFLDTFWSLEDSFKTAPPWDFVSLSASAKLVPNRGGAPPEQRWFPPIVPYFHTRCTDSMVFRVSMLKRLLETMKPFSEVLDWELNFQLSLHKSRSFWLDPPVTKAGSEGSAQGKGVYGTSI